jgi:hypothetical protein
VVLANSLKDADDIGQMDVWSLIFRLPAERGAAKILVVPTPCNRPGIHKSRPNFTLLIARKVAARLALWGYRILNRCLTLFWTPHVLTARGMGQ